MAEPAKTGAEPKLPPEFYHSPESKEYWLIWGCLWAWLAWPLYLICLWLNASDRAAFMVSITWVGLFSILPVYLKTRGDRNPHRKPFVHLTHEQAVYRLLQKLKDMDSEFLEDIWAATYPGVILTYNDGLYEVRPTGGYRLKCRFKDYETTSSGSKRATMTIIESDHPRLPVGFGLTTRLDTGFPADMPPGQYFHTDCHLIKGKLYFESIKKCDNNTAK